MTYIVKVQDYDGSNKFQINGLRQKIVVANAGDTIVFDQSDGSNAGHPLVVALYTDGHRNAGGNEYTTGVTKNGTPGSPGANTTFILNNQNLNGTYYYYCQNHDDMGGMIHFGADTDINGETIYPIIDEGAIAYDAQDNNENLTSNINKTVEKWDDVGTNGWENQGQYYGSITPHTNPWKISDTDTQTSGLYKVTYNVTDSGGLSAPTRTKIFNIGSINQTTGLLTLRNRDEYLYGDSVNISSNYGWIGGAMLGIWGWQGMPDLSKFNFTSNNYTSATWSNALAYWYVPSGNAWNKKISFEVPLNTWIQCISFGKYTGDYNYGYTIGLHRNTFSTGNQHFRSRCIEDSDYPNGNTSSRIRFPGSNVTNWNGYDANHLYPPGSPENGSANQEAWRGLSGETERNGSIGTKNSYHASSQREHVSVFKILDSVTVDFNFGNIF